MVLVALFPVLFPPLWTRPLQPTLPWPDPHILILSRIPAWGLFPSHSTRATWVISFISIVIQSIKPCWLSQISSPDFCIIPHPSSFLPFDFSVITTSLTRAVANNHVIMQTEIPENVWPLASPECLVQTSKCCVSKRMSVFSLCDYSKMLPSTDPRLLTTSLILSFRTLSFISLRRWNSPDKNSLHFLPHASHKPCQHPHPSSPLPWEKGAPFPPKVISSSCVLGLIFIYCLKDLSCMYF